MVAKGVVAIEWGLKVLKADVFLRDQVAPKIWPVFATVLRTAYAAADGLVQDNPILQVESAKDNKGRLIQWAVDFGLERAVETSLLPCDYRWQPFANPTGRYLELIFSHSRLTVSQVQSPKRQPRRVVFRENAKLGNGQSVLDLGDVIESERDEEVVNLPHILLLHGHQSLDFAHLSIPSATSSTRLLCTSENLLRLPHAIPETGPAPEDTDYDLEAMKLLKERIEKWQKDNGS